MKNHFFALSLAIFATLFYSCVADGIDTIVVPESHEMYLAMQSSSSEEISSSSSMSDSSSYEHSSSSEEIFSSSSTSTPSPTPTPTPTPTPSPTPTPPKTYTIVIDILDNEAGDKVTISPDRGIAGTTVTLTYTVADTKHYNQLEFGGVDAAIASIDEAGTGTRTYTISAADATDDVITITAVFAHTNLEIDHIAFSEHNEGHITKTYGDAAFTNAVTSAHKGSGAITYHSSDATVASVNGSGQVTIHKAGSAVISAKKAADAVYAHAQTTYTLTVNPKPVTITGLSASNKAYDGTVTATVTGTAVISGVISGDNVTVIAGTASFADKEVGNNKTVTFSGWSLGGSDAGNYTLSAQPASVTANITPDGSADAPFLVATQADFRKVGRGTDGWTVSAHYKQTANITMTSTFAPIGNSTDRFTGTYDGGGYTITDFSISDNISNLGIFAYIGSGGTVKNMNATGTITQSGAQFTGGIAGANVGTIENCVFNGTVNGGTASDQIGGITGYNYGTVINSRNNATVSGKNAVGGIAGVNQGKMERCYNTGAVSGSQQVGGIAGVNTNSDNTNYLRNCYNTGDITATAASSSHAGGIVGLNQLNALVGYCYNTGNITGTGYIGGITGNNSGSTVQYCVSLGAKITTTNSSLYAGRVAGNDGGTLVNNTARADMKKGASGAEVVSTANIGAADINGANVTVGSSTIQTTVFSGWDIGGWNTSTIWTLNATLLLSGSDLPTLKANTQSPAPTLPAAAP